MTKKQKYTLTHANFGGGMNIAASNIIKNGDYASIVLLSGVTHLIDGMCITLDMNRDFNNKNAVDQVKEYLRSINPNISFSDEPKETKKLYGDENLFTKTQVSSAIKAVGTQSISDDDLKIMEWAQKKGYARRQSFTQAEWTQAGLVWAQTAPN